MDVFDLTAIWDEPLFCHVFILIPITFSKSPLLRDSGLLAIREFELGLRRSNQSILEEIRPEYSLEGLMLKLKLQYFGHLMQRTDSLEKTLMLGKIVDRRRG